MARKRTRPRVNARKELRKASEAAREYAADTEKAELLVKEAQAKARRNKASLAAVWDDLLAMFRMVAAWARGDYRDVPWRTILFIIGAIIYFVNPFDVVPDFIPGLGYIDDAAVIGAVLASFGREVKNFVEWERQRP